MRLHSPSMFWIAVIPVLSLSYESSPIINEKPLYHYCLAAFRPPLTLLKGVLASPGRLTGKSVTVCCRSR
ncbi:hypothetical protein GQ600_23492 [Phytophthora cactorum]|nr:hypothetical protein GQ600_23492 [Phytophthora cactorum]